jgi:probable phosphoglycerate mutase
MTVVYLIRHGLNDWTGKRLIGGTPGVHLNATGRQQAVAVAAALRKLPIESIYSSPLERAMETAEPLSQLLNLPIQPHEGLKEVNFGDWQGFTTQRMKRQKLFKTVQEKPSEVQFPGGESFAEAQARVISTLREITSNGEHPKALACFSHADVIRLAIAGLIGLPLDAFQSLNAETGSISVIAMGSARCALLKLNWMPGESF